MAEVDTEVDEVRALEEDALVVVEDEVEELGLAMLVTTRWHVTDVGCVAIWPVTVPKKCSHREVELPTLPV